MKDEQRGQRRLIHPYEDYSGIKGAYPDIPLECYQPSEHEVIVARFNPKDFSLSDYLGFYQDLKLAFNRNTVVFLPENISLESMTHEQLQALLTDVQNMIKKLLSDENKK